MASVWGELKRRNVVKVAGAYAIVGWLLVEVTSTVLPTFDAPQWVVQTITFVIILGFPLALIFAWAYELTPDGLIKEKDVDRSESTTHNTGRKLDFIIITVLVLALVYFGFDKFVVDPSRDAELVQTTTEAITEQAAESDQAKSAEKSIAVLPFENRSNREEDQFFTDGIHDDLLTTIAKIGSMKVISRTSVMEYRDTIKKIPQIAKELGVAHILEGGIQRSGNQVRINVRLIDAATDKRLWAQTFNRELTAENLFVVQSEITRLIADALQAELSTDEQRRIDARPTDNLQAYEAYMRGRQLMATRNTAKLKRATEEFSKATEIDPMFALAWVGVADSHSLLLGRRDVRDEDLLPIIEDAVKNALAIDNGLGEAYASLGLMHATQGRNDEAETAYQKAIELSPSYASAYEWYSRHVGTDPLRILESVDLMQKAAILDPSSAIISLTLGGVYRNKGLYTLAERQYRKVIELDPDFEATYFYLSYLYLFDMGQFDKALALINKAIALNPESYSQKMVQGSIYMQLGDLEAHQEIRDKLADSGAEEWLLGLFDVHTSFGKGNTTDTRETINWLLPKIQGSYSFRLRLGLIALAQGDIQLSREIFLSGEPGWLEPDQWPALIGSIGFWNQTGCIVAWLFMNTGDQELGAALLQQTTAYIEDSLPLVTEHPDQFFPELCYLTAGDTEKALLSIETQLTHNHLRNWYIVHPMPMYDLIRHEPRYQAAWAEHERRISVQRENIEKMAADQVPSGQTQP